MRQVSSSSCRSGTSSSGGRSSGHEPGVRSGAGRVAASPTLALRVRSRRAGRGHVGRRSDAGCLRSDSRRRPRAGQGGRLRDERATARDTPGEDRRRICGAGARSWRAVYVVAAVLMVLLAVCVLDAAARPSRDRPSRATAMPSGRSSTVQTRADPQKAVACTGCSRSQLSRFCGRASHSCCPRAPYHYGTGTIGLFGLAGAAGAGDGFCSGTARGPRPSGQGDRVHRRRDPRRLRDHVGRARRSSVALIIGIVVLDSGVRESTSRTRARSTSSPRKPEAGSTPPT